jgi:hypothetical protein
LSIDSLKEKQTVWRTRPIRFTLPALLCAFGGAAALALASGGPPTPTITKAPVNPTKSTSASFSFTDSQTGVTFLCALDGSSYSACLSPKSYSKLAAGTHTFSVQAKDKAGNVSGPASYSWRIDLAAPAIAIVSPANGGFYNGAGWGAGCASGPGVCGTASDPSGVASVKLSIKQDATGKYWSGTGFTSSLQTFKLATLSATGQTATGWFYGLPLPALDGKYTLDVLAADKLGNATPTASPTVSVFTIKTTPPPSPAITSAPPNPSTSTSAQFAFTDSATGTTFQCELDAGAFAGCTSPTSYSNLTAGSHTFEVRAVDAAGNVSTATAYSWTISPPNGTPFTVGGDVPGALYPGAAPQAIPVTLTNPNTVAIYVTSLTVTVQSSASGCDANTNFVLTQSSISSTQPVQVPADGTLTLTGADAPSIQMLDTNTDQDACRGVHLTLSYSGSAHS